MKGWQVVGILFVIILIGAAGWASQQAINSYSQPMGSGGQSAGQGREIEYIPLNTAFGEYFQIEVTSLNGRPLNVYMTNLTNLLNVQQGQPFEYDPQRSQLNTTHVKMDLRISSGSEIGEVVITSSDPQDIVPISVHAEQSSLPIELKAVFLASSFICWISSISLFVLLIHAISKYRSDRSRYA